MPSSASSESESESIVSSVGSGLSSPSTPVSHSPVYLTSYSPIRPWYRPHISFRAGILILLPLLSLLGAFGTWTLASTNGTFKSIVALIAQPEAQLPGTNEDLIRVYTGLRLVDKQLSILVIFFAPVVDLNVLNGNGALNLFSIFGAGQFGAVWCLMVMESLRMGNHARGARVVSFTFIGIIGFILQNISFTVTVPLWLLIHIIFSPVAKPFPGTHANSMLLIPTWDLKVLPYSIILGYILPTILMALPSPTFVWPETHQRYIALWQAFPIWTVIAHIILRSAGQWFKRKAAGKKSDSNSQTPQGASYLGNAKHIYRFVLGLCISTHVPVLLLAIFPAHIIENPSSTLAHLAQNTLNSIYVPYFPYPLDYQISSLAEGVHTFLMWDLYVGSAAFLLWSVLLYRNATMEKRIVDPTSSLPIYRGLLLGGGKKGTGESRRLLAKIGTWTVVSGPIGAVTVLLWERDMIATQKIKQGI